MEVLEVNYHCETFLADDGYRLCYDRYPARGPARGVVACFHGIQSHSGWYRGSSAQLARAGYEVFFFNRRGSGPHDEDRGHCRNHAQLCADMALCLETARCRAAESHGPLPLFVLAISWGGKLAVATLATPPPRVAGLILVCPGWFAKVAPSRREKLVIGSAFLFAPRRLIPIPLSDPALFTAQPHWQAYLREDPFSLRFGTARLLMSSRILDRIIRQVPPNLGMSSLLLLAGQDHIIDNLPTRQFFARFAATDKTVLEYPAAHHTLEFEPDAAAINDAVIAWLNQRAEPS